jgi:Fe-S cluster biogenesis protein NfuA
LDAQVAGDSASAGHFFREWEFMHKNAAVQQQTGRIEELIRKLESSADPGSLATARELVQSLMELYGAGLERISEIVATKGAAGREILDELGRDELVGNLLAANGLHPVDLETRVRRAIEKLGARFRSQGSVVLLGIEEGVVRLRLESSGSGCGSSAGSLKSAVEEAMYEAAPDLIQLAIETVGEQTAASGFVPLEKLAGYGAAATNGAAHGRSARI